MEITIEEMQRRLASPKNLANTVVAPSKADISRQILAGTLVKTGESANEVAKVMNLDIPQVKQAARTSDPVIADPRDSGINRVRDLAIEKTLIALGAMTPDKFESADLKSLSSVAANLSRVVDKTTERERDRNTTVNVVLYSPVAKSESDFKVIDI